MLASLLDKTATHARLASAKNAIGGDTPARTTLASDVPCAVWPVASGTVRDLLRRDILGTHVVATAVDLSAKANDVLVVDGRDYLVRGVEKFEHSGVCGDVLVIYDCDLRTV